MSNLSSVLLLRLTGKLLTRKNCHFNLKTVNLRWTSFKLSKCTIHSRVSTCQTVSSHPMCRVRRQWNKIRIENCQQLYEGHENEAEKRKSCALWTCETGGDLEALQLNGCRLTVRQSSTMSSVSAKRRVINTNNREKHQLRHLNLVISH